MTGGTEAADAALEIQRRAPGFVPRLALVLGSGLGPLADQVEDAVTVPYDDLAGFPPVAVEGHAGRLVLGTLAGVPVACLQGRGHAYEGRFDVMKSAIRAMKLIGCEAVYLTCAAGSLRDDMPPGSLMTLGDHINLMGGNPLVGPNDEDFGPRFPPLIDAYDPALRALQVQAAEGLGRQPFEGVYCGWLGPSFETPAEVRMIQRLGADAVGMSTVPECILARHCGLLVTATAVITNYGVGLTEQQVNHAQTLSGAAAASDGLHDLILGFLARLATA
ncbi:MAG: purine-nucleoside phosphorylase [Alphaproteobacteria bacterium]|jgi:xanthosine phosphorylase|nr:purine-nucleoside phosphorylase [Alphaproteobacteria bacterium]